MGLRFISCPCLSTILFEPRYEKTGLRGFRHKPGCTATEDGWRLEILDLGSVGGGGSTIRVAKT